MFDSRDIFLLINNSKAWKPLKAFDTLFIKMGTLLKKRPLCFFQGMWLHEDHSNAFKSVSNNTNSVLFSRVSPLNFLLFLITCEYLYASVHVSTGAHGDQRGHLNPWSLITLSCELPNLNPVRTKLEYSVSAVCVFNHWTILPASWVGFLKTKQTEIKCML